jgi:uncharacterized protein (TIGR02145 family)
VEIVPDYYPVGYGLLYNWYAATDDRNICSDGWEVPTNTQWETLISYLGGNSIAGGKLKEIGFISWDAPNTGATNEVGFNAKGAGYRETEGGLDFRVLKAMGAFMTKSSQISFIYYAVLGNYDASIVVTADAYKIYGLSIRLIKTTTTLTHGQTGTYVGNDGKDYRTICIGTQEWLADNLCETQFRNGDYIPFNECDDLHSFSNIEWANLETAGCCPYDNDWSNVPMAQPTGEACPALELTFDDIANVPVADASSVSDWNTFFDLPTNGSPFTSVEVIGNMVRLIGGSEITIADDLFNQDGYLIGINDSSNCIIAVGNSSFWYSSLSVANFPACVIVGNAAFAYTNCVFNMVNLVTAGDGSFQECYNSGFSFPELQNIGYNCFADCYEVPSFSLPKLKNITGDSNFVNCESCEEFNFPELLSINAYEFLNCISATSFYLPKCTSIGQTFNDHIFYGISGQTITLTIPAALMTCNSGNPDGDIQYLIDNNTVTIVTV